MMSTIALPSSLSTVYKATNSSHRSHTTSRGRRSRLVGLSAQYPNKTTIQTSLFQYPSDSSLAPYCTQDSSSKLPAVDIPRVFTAVIAPLAGVPPTSPLPPTPPLEAAELDHSKGKVPERPGLLFRYDDGMPKMETTGKVKNLGVVVGLITAPSGDERAKRCLRRVKGNVAEAAAKYRQKDGSICHPTNVHGLPTPGSTPPTTVSQLRYPSCSSSFASSSVDDDTSQHDDSSDDEDGGIALEFDDLDKVGQRVWLNTNNRDFVKTEALTTPGIPRPDSPSVIGAAFQLDEDEAREEKPSVIEQESMTVRLLACEKSYPEFVTPARVNSEKAETVFCDAESNLNDGIVIVNTARPKIPVRRSTNSTTISVIGGVPLEPVSEKPSEERTAIVMEREQEKALDEVDVRIKQSSIVKRRLAIRANLENKFTPIDSSETGNVELPKTSPDTGEDNSKEKSQQSSSNTCVILYESPQPPATQNDNFQVTRPLLAPPSLPRFNFIPPTPLTLTTPMTLMERELTGMFPPHHILADSDDSGVSREALLRQRSSSRPSTRSSSRTRPSLVSQPTRFRDSKLHPWWKPRSYWQDEQDDLAKLLSDTEMVSPDQKRTPRISEEPVEDENDCKKDKRRRWSGVGPGVVVSVVKKRRVLTLGKMEIEFIGIDRLMGRLKMNKKDGAETDKQASQMVPKSPASPKGQKRYTR